MRTDLRLGRRAAIALIAALPVAARAQSPAYPTRPVRIIVPFPPAAGTDILARAYGQALSEHWGQPVVIENRAGASGLIGAEAAARSAPDGYTILMSNSSTLAISPAIRTTMPYNSVTDFAPVALVGANDSALVVRANSPFRTLSEVVEAARARPGILTYSSAGTGTSTHMAAEFFKQMAGVEIEHVPYRGSAPALTDMLGGQVDMNFNTINAVMTAVRNGQARALATTGATRDPLLPDTPTFAELGLTGYSASGWLGFVVPAATPPEIVSSIANAIRRVGSVPAFRERVASIGMRPLMSTPAEFRAIIGPEIARWTEVARLAGVKVE
jgi:tripartite-type tricarboxylate transporter receptor subunit TctC